MSVVSVTSSRGSWSLYRLKKFHLRYTERLRRTTYYCQHRNRLHVFCSKILARTCLEHTLHSARTSRKVSDVWMDSSAFFRAAASGIFTTWESWMKWNTLISSFKLNINLRQSNQNTVWVMIRLITILLMRKKLKSFEQLIFWFSSSLHQIVPKFQWIYFYSSLAPFWIQNVPINHCFIHEFQRILNAFILRLKLKIGVELDQKQSEYSTESLKYPNQCKAWNNF